ncbi:hypothetical protein Tco_0544489, partial [Tanacetum coccineum]
HKKFIVEFTSKPKYSDERISRMKNEKQIQKTSTWTEVLENEAFSRHAANSKDDKKCMKKAFEDVSSCYEQKSNQDRDHR